MTELRERLQSSLGAAYSLERELGGGGMSRVYVAHESALGRQVVVKVLAPELAAEVNVERFEREIKTAARLQHPQIVPVLSAGDVGGVPYYTMPYIDGETLRARLSRGPLGFRDAIEILRDVAKALAYAHGRGFAHRDIKPDNILLTGGSAVVTDFGIAKAIEASQAGRGAAPTLTQVGMALGTPAYMAPEQAAADPAIDHRADLYAFGCVSYEMLAGAPPFTGRTTGALLAAHLTQQPAPLASHRLDVPPALAAMVMSCLEKDPAARPGGASLLLESLNAATAELSGARPGLARPTAAAKTAPEQLSIAVLPFSNSGAADDEYLSDGISEEIINVLGTVPGLRVAARTSAFAFKGKTTDIGEIARQLRVRLVLEGSVRHAGTRVRISTQLIEADTGLQIWSERYDREMRDVLAMQDDIAGAIVAMLRERLDLKGATTPRPDRAAEQHGNPEAYELYLRARHFWQKQTAEGLARAAEHLNRVIALEPRHALAQAALADIYYTRFTLNLLPTAEAMQGLRSAAHRAIEFDDGLSESHVALGVISHWGDYDLAAAERAFKRAVEINPSNALAHSHRAFNLTTLGEHDAAIAAVERAILLDPISAVIRSNAPHAYLCARRYDEALRCAEEGVAIDPNAAWAQGFLGIIHSVRGNHEAAITIYQELDRRMDWGRRSNGAFLGCLLGRAGRYDEARQRLAQIEAVASADPQPAWEPALVYLGLGEYERAIEIFERAFDARTLYPGMLAPDPLMDPLRPFPRYRRMLERLGLDPAKFDPPQLPDLVAS